MDQEYFYIPVSSLNFTNLTSTDSLSPPRHYQRRGYGFRRFEKTQSNPFEHVILAYSRPIEEPERKTEREEFLMHVRLHRSNLDCTHQVEGDAMKILVIDKTVYFNPFTCELIFRNDEQRKRTFAQGMKSLEAKFTPYYQRNALLLSELDLKISPWNEDFISGISDGKFSPQKIDGDQRINKIKGTIFGLASGLLCARSAEISRAKEFIREYNNEFSGILNKLSTVGSGTKKGSVSINDLRPSLDKLETLSSNILLLTAAIQTKEELTVISEITSAPIPEIENWKSYKLNKGESVYDLILTHLQGNYLNVLPLQNIYAHLNSRILQVARYKSPKDYNSLQDLYSKIRHDINDKIRAFERQESQSNKLEHIPLEFDLDLTLKHAQLEGLSDSEKFIFIALINEVLRSPETSSADEIANSRENIIEFLGKHLTENQDGSKEINDAINFLRHLYRSLKSLGSGFKIEKGKNLILKILATFVSKYSELEKYNNALAKNQLNNFGVAYSIWGSAYGYANLSKLMVDALEHDEISAKVAFDFVDKILHPENSIAESQPTEPVQEESPVRKTWDFSSGSGESEEGTDQRTRDPHLPQKLESLLIEDAIFQNQPNWIDFALSTLETTLKSTRLIDDNNVLVSDFRKAIQKKSPSGFGAKKVDGIIEHLKSCMD